MPHRNNFINIGLLTQLPLFLTTTLNASPELLAVGTTLPYICNIVVAALAGVAADALIASGRASRTAVRKGFTAVGIGCSGVLLFGAGSTGNDARSAVALLVAAFGVLGLGQAGWQSLYLDAFGELSGTAFSYSNTLATLSGIAAPIIAAAFVENLGTSAGYRATFAVFGPLIGLPAVSFFCCTPPPRPLRSGLTLRAKFYSCRCSRADPQSRRRTPSRRRLRPRPDGTAQ